jgi:mono/diheme cytochrome c family protein
MTLATLIVALLAVAAGPALPRGDATNGRELYLEKCALCHGAQGQGWDWTAKVAKPPVPVPDLATVVPTRSDRFLFDVIKDGGEGVGKTRFMPPFAFQLNDQEVWDLVAYMRSLRELKR